jgi:diaminohydroxyphosphoribosylaminopyrimidine deaminase/5-amino-6-(5-phosphoribosylamino)uracil reductase
VVVDRHHRISKDAKIFSHDAPTIVYDKQTDWPYILDDLASRGIHSILVEGGPTLLNHILESGIWDEMHIEVSPVTIGEGVPAPQVALPDSFELVDGERLYTIYHSGNKNCDYSHEK